MTELQIAAFPKGDGLWRVDWFGGVQFPNRILRRTQPSVFVHLSRVTDPLVLADPMAPVSASSTLPWQRQFRCWVSVGSTMLLRIGDLWSDQRFVASPEHEVETFENIRIDRTTAQLLKVGHSDANDNFLLPAAEHPWHMANTHSYCVRVDLGAGRSMVVPSMELARFYFGSSSPLLASLFQPPFDAKRLYSAVRFTDFFGEDVELDLADGVPEESGPDIARIAVDKTAANAAALIGVSLLRPPLDGVDDNYPKCVFPFEGVAKLKASGKWLALGGQARSTFLVYRLRTCWHPLPFKTLKVKTSGAKRRSWRPTVQSSNGRAQHRAGAPDAKEQTLRERDGSGALTPRASKVMLREVKFPDLLNKRVWSEAHMATGGGSPVGARGSAAVTDVAVGQPGSVQRIRSISLVEALARTDSPPAFLLPTIERFARLKRLQVTLLTASADDGWTVPIRYVASEDGEIPPSAFVAEGGAERIRRVAAFLIRGSRRTACVAVKELDEGKAYTEREPGDLCLSSFLARASCLTGGADL